MNIVCLDLEGVLVPEIWISFSKATGIKELSLTTRDISDYDELMQRRIRILKSRDLKLGDIQKVIAGMEVLSGAKRFLNTLRKEYQVIILSDTFTQFAKPLMEKLSWPTLFCNTLEINGDGEIINYHLRQENGKREAVKALKKLNMKIVAAGDSYNDVAMLKEADYGILFRAPDSIKREFPDLPAAETYQTLLKKIRSNLG